MRSSFRLSHALASLTPAWPHKMEHLPRGQKTQAEYHKFWSFFINIHIMSYLMVLTYEITNSIGASFLPTVQ